MLRQLLVFLATTGVLGACQPSLSESGGSESTEVEAGAVQVDASSLPSPTLDAGGPADAAQDASDGPEAADPAPEADLHPAFSYQPSNVQLADIDFSRAPAAVLDCGEVRIDSSSSDPFEAWCGELPPAVTRAQTDGPDVFVIPLRSLSVEQETRVIVRGKLPVVFLVEGNVSVRGVIDAGGDGPTPGAGGNVGCGASAGGDARGREGRHGGGGGGGAFGTAGGDGAVEDAINNSLPGVAGVPRGTAELIPLIGGCPGGLGGGCAGRPGAGGGALQISASGSIVVSGALRVDGGKGARGCYTAAGGTGGGSGGGLLLEATAVRVDGTISAAGGDGGPGQISGEPGTGATHASEPGGAGSGDATGAGAGGGGFGRIRVRAQQRAASAL
jgi:hypothetical protein